jgi:hypothetical protein
VTCLKTGVLEFSNPLDQSGHAWCHVLLSPLLINERGVQLPVRPLRPDMHID